MQPQEQARAKAVLSEALKVPSHDRIRLIQEAFPDDPKAWDELLEILDTFSKASEANSDWTGGTTFGNLVPEFAAGDPQPTAALLTIGASFGPYRVARRLKPGGMGEVAIADDVRLPRKVVLKCLAGRWLAAPMARQRLLREARTAAALNHRSIATLYDVLDDHVHPLLVMEFVEGKSLHEVLAEGPVPLGLALRYAIQITEAVGYAHDRGIIHCDIKPANIQITPEGIAKVLDFGLARAQFDPGDELSASERGKVLGTPGYMAPERLTRGTLNASGDIYGLGVVLFELLTSRDPYSERGHALMLAVLASDAPAPSALIPSLPRALDTIVGRALARDPVLRYRSARELGRDLEEVLASIEGHSGSGQRPIELVARPETPFAKDWRRIAAVGIPLLAMVLTFAGFATSSFYNSPLGRTEGFEESPLTWPRWGVSSLVAPTLYMTLVALGLVFLVVFCRFLLATIKPLGRVCRPIFATADHVFRQLRSVPPATFAAFLLLFHVLVISLFIWRFWPIVDALHTFVTQLPGASLGALAPANRPEHSLFGRGVTIQVMIFGLAWYWVLKNAGGVLERDAAALVAGGVVITLLSLLFGQIIPFRILYHSDAERVSYQSRACHMVGQKDDEALLFCPRQPPAWSRVVKLEDPELKREGVYESIFTGLERNN